MLILVCSKGRKKGYDEYEIVLILKQNIRVFLGLHKLTHGLTFGIIYFCKYSWVSLEPDGSHN